MHEQSNSTPPPPAADKTNSLQMHVINSMYRKFIALAIISNDTGVHVQKISVLKITYSVLNAIS